MQGVRMSWTKHSGTDVEHGAGFLLRFLPSARIVKDAGEVPPAVQRARVARAEVTGPNGQNGPVLRFRLGQPAQAMQGHRAQIAAGHSDVMLGPKNACADIPDGAKLSLSLSRLVQPGQRERPAIAGRQH